MMGHITTPALKCVTTPPDRPHALELVRPENWVRGEHYTKEGFGRYAVDFFHDSYYERDGRRVVLREVEHCIDADGLKLMSRSRTVHELLPDGSEDVWPA